MRRMRTLLVFLCVSLMVLISSKIKAQIVINEFLASNTGLIEDPDFSESGDWIELYNTGISTFSIGGYYISDNFKDSIKWQIPFETKIEAGGYLIIWADGFNTGLHTSF